MARQKGIIKLKGKIGDISFYKTQDGHLARERAAQRVEPVDAAAGPPRHHHVDPEGPVELGERCGVGGVGGLPDFVRAAVQAPRGQSVLALAARTPRGKPRIVPRLSGPCTVAACDADVVVTEHGVARLWDASVGERVRSMLALADPEDRAGLEAAARASGLL